ncbi:hypothetical protein PSACC_02183 [Paramicrosporidium saccamoebae]|uniref:Uncharacterized protein n=1 Tax=Paramicrosporidium saccamoebae TaxID=1246581 RepID=A0A2H9TJV3_9FUNG|nr:hypothetical protein PSACC_02183 [Paramicrosporidium saccamoebae]
MTGAYQDSRENTYDSQFAPFIDEIIDTNELDMALAPVEKRDQWESNSNVGGSKHILHEMSIVKSRIGFSEQQFRDKCQKLQSELCQEFKEIVDGIYDALDAMVADFSKTMYQVQMDSLRDFEKQLSEVRRVSLQAGTL